MFTIERNLRSELERILLEPDFVFTPKKDFENRIKERLNGISRVKGAELAVICLEALAPENPGIRHIAGHHGGAILPFYEFFTKSPLHAEYVHVPHEQIAGHIAEGLANTGVVGVAVVTSGPGGTNGITSFEIKSNEMSFQTPSYSKEVFPEPACVKEYNSSVPFFDL